MTSIPTGSTIGIIGGGQLGRMTALAAANLGYKTHIYCPEEGCPASLVSSYFTLGSYSDKEKLSQFASSVSVVTFEFENIPHESVKLLAEKAITRPGWNALHISQNRLREKDFVTALGIKTAPYRAVSNKEDLASAVHDLGFPCILKTTEQGYDGKGQHLMETAADIDQITNYPEKDFYVLEGFVDYSKEISVVLARSINGEISCFPPTENRHLRGILDCSIVPADINESVADSAIIMASKIAEKLEIVGLLTIEFFVTDDQRLLVNEMAPRPHNSGHWTMDGCYTSQFEQFVRAVCGLPFGSTTIHSRSIMKNLIGNDINDWQHYIAEPSTKLHIYGKSEVKDGRKMGHITKLMPL